MPKISELKNITDTELLEQDWAVAAAIPDATVRIQKAAFLRGLNIKTSGVKLDIPNWKNYDNFNAFLSILDKLPKTAIGAGEGLSWTGTLSESPRISFTAGTLASLKKADTAVQPSDLPDLTGYIKNNSGVGNNISFTGNTRITVNLDDWKKQYPDVPPGEGGISISGTPGHQSVSFSMRQSGASWATALFIGNPDAPFTFNEAITVVNPRGPLETYRNTVNGGKFDADGDIYGTKWLLSGESTIQRRSLSSYLNNRFEYLRNVDNHVSGNNNVTYSKADKAVVDKLSKISNAGVMEYIATLKTPAGRLKLNGGVYERATYPELWAFIETSDLLVDDAAWLAGDFGKFSRGNGSTTFRVMDTRGHTIKVFDDGRGVDAGRVAGSYQGDAIRNIEGSFGAVTLKADAWCVGAFKNIAYTPNQGLFGSKSETISVNGIAFDASKMVPTAPEVRVKNLAYPQYVRYI